jgi:hypothetical protein
MRSESTQRASRRVVAVACLALAATVGGISVSGAAASTPKAAPKCTSVSVALVRQSLGGSPSKPKAQSSSGVLICHYTTVDLVYLLNQSKAVFRADQLSNKGRAIPGIGDGAFSYSTKDSSLVSLQVLHGNIAFLISGTSATLSRQEKLAKKVLPLV